MRPTAEKRSFLEDILWWVSFTFLTLFFLVHFLLVTLSNLPRSPLTTQTQLIVNRYINPYFSQTWNFFAPEPISNSLNLIARARYYDPTTHSTRETAWTDVSEPLVNEVRRSRISPLAIVQLGLSNVVTEFVNRVGANAKLSKADPDHPGLRILNSPLPAAADPLDILVMTRTALAMLELNTPDTKFTQVQIAVTQHEFPRFSKRFTADNPTQVALYLVDWQDGHYVTPYCCAKGGFK
jgi:Family of unknown function (DUF5819)